MNATETTYRIEFGTAWLVPPITVDFTDRAAAARQVTEHAIPYLRSVLLNKGRPELADCIFHAASDMSGGHFLWLDFQSGLGARFCPARITPAGA